jgi:phage FluMu protein Com
MRKRRLRNPDGSSRCVSCGAVMTKGPLGYLDHHCTKSHEAAMMSANTRHTTPIVRTQAWYERLSQGVAIHSLAGDMD